MNLREFMAGQTNLDWSQFKIFSLKIKVTVLDSVFAREHFWDAETVADLVNSPPVFLVVLQHAGPQHVHYLWKLLIHEGGSN